MEMTTTAIEAPASGLLDELRRHIGRFSERQPDWDAFPANLTRTLRARRSASSAPAARPAFDPSTMKAEHFTLSLVYWRAITPRRTSTRSKRRSLSCRAC
jgi:hypothetical protein